MPAMKSRKRLPSPSSTITPCPRPTPSGYSLLYQLEVYGVRLGQRLVQTVHLTNREDRHEQLLPEERAGERETRHRGGDEVPPIEDSTGEPRAPQQDRPFGAGLRRGALVALDRALID